MNRHHTFACVSRGALLTAVLALAACSALSPQSTAPRRLDASGFDALLTRLATGWNGGDSRAASECFTPNAIYVEPPRKQVYRGRDALFQFFGGSAGRPGQMSMRWHRIVFDPATQRGMGEFTFDYGGQVHGVAVIDVSGGLIDQWREYWYESALPFDEFVLPGRP